MTDLLHVEHLTAGYGEAVVLNQVSFSLEAGETLALLGRNGTGKTTSSAKLAALLKSRGQSVLLCAADTFRAAAVEQLKSWGDRLGVEVVSSEYGADPAALCHDALA